MAIPPEGPGEANPDDDEAMAESASVIRLVNEISDRGGPRADQ